MSQVRTGGVAYIAPQITDLGGHATFVQGSYPGSRTQDNVVPCPPGFPGTCYLSASPL